MHVSLILQYFVSNVEGPERIAELAKDLSERVGVERLAAPQSYYRVLEIMADIATRKLTIAKDDLEARCLNEPELAEAEHFDLTFALRFWHRLGRCIWLENRPELPVVVNVEDASAIFGQVLCSASPEVLDELRKHSWLTSRSVPAEVQRTARVSQTG